MFMNDNSVSKLTCNACMYSVLTVSVLVMGIGSDRGGLIRPPMWLTFPPEPSHGCHALILLFHITMMFCSLHHLQLLKDILNSVSSVWWLAMTFSLYCGIIANKPDFELMTSLLQKTKISFCLGSQRPQLLNTMGRDFISVICVDRTFYAFKIPNECVWISVIEVSFFYIYIHTYI